MYSDSPVYLKVWCCFVFIICFAHAQEVGEDCVLADGSVAQCTSVDICETAKQDITERRRPQQCGFEGGTPIVCCRKSPGAKAKYFCEVYYAQTNPRFIVHGTIVKPKDNQHMVALGFGNRSNIQWLCGGSLISRNFILTAAHCVASTEYGEVRWARIGELNITNANVSTNTGGSSDYQIIETYRHPEYKPPSRYNDIALLKLSDDVNLNMNRRPACINTDYNIPAKFTPTATGWGLTSYGGSKSERLLEVDLNLVSQERCRATYASEPSKRLGNGIDYTSQLCAIGDVIDDQSKDTCQGDSGGPLQIKHPIHSDTFYLIIGITSFGKPCGFATPGVYTRVSNYVPWIESIVWKNQAI